MRNFLTKIGMGISRFMQGRYGNDKLNLFILVAAIVLDILAMFFRIPGVYAVLSLLSMALLCFAVFRTMSKNIQARYQEGQKFEKFLSRIKDAKTHHIYKCPECGQKIRVPRKNGVKVEITCPKCKARFEKKI